MEKRMSQLIASISSIPCQPVAVESIEYKTIPQLLISRNEMYALQSNDKKNKSHYRCDGSLKRRK
jgi:hypothetical protein